MNLELWVVTGLIAVIFKTGYHSWQKNLNKQYESLTLARTAVLTTLVLMTITSIVMQVKIPSHQGLGLAVLSGSLLYVGLYSFNCSMNYSELSVSSPLQQTIPIFVAVIEPVVISSIGYDLNVVISAVVVVIGAYLITVEENSYKTPIQNITSKGPLFALLSAVLFATSSVITYYTTQFVPIPVYIAIQSIAGFIILTVLNKEIKLNLDKRTVGYGSLYSFTVTFDIITISLISASIATVFLRLSLVLSVLIGLFVYGDNNRIGKLVGALLIVGAVLIISLL